MQVELTVAPLRSPFPILWSTLLKAKVAFIVAYVCLDNMKMYVFVIEIKKVSYQSKISRTLSGCGALLQSYLQKASA